MLLNYSLGVALLITAGIIVFILGLWGMNKLKLSPKLFIIPLIIAIIAAAFIGTMTKRIYEYTRDKQVVSFMAFGGSEYVATDGQKVPYGQMKRGNCIVNASDAMLQLEEVRYGGLSFSFSSPEPEIIKAHAYYFGSGSIDFFPNETPPESISVDKKSSGSTIRNWLHEVETYEDRDTMGHSEN